MTAPLFSPSWYRVAALTPRLRSHTAIHRHQYRGETWYVLQDRSTERFHRFSPAGYFIIGLMNGRRSVHELWEIATARLGDDAPTQDEMIQLLSQLHGADVLQCDVSPDTAELLQRSTRQRRRKWQANVLSPLSWRFPVLDPERFLCWLLPVARPFFGVAGALLWLVVVPPALAMAGSHWDELTRNVLDRILAPQNLVYVWLLFPVVKTLHEFGHAFAVKAYGGEVHDMGVMVLVLTPVPYVDASAASAFREKWRRIAVGAAGMLVELFVAALALFVWLSAQPGLVRTLAYNTMLIAGVSTILFNGNPLLRYDGYYILMDLLEIPNLRSRANRYVLYLGERYLFGRREAELPHATPGERAWFVVYAISSFAYRTVLIFAIALFIATKFFVVGVLLAVGAGLSWIGIPVVRGIAYLLTDRRLRTVRGRAITVSVGLGVLLIGVITLVPAPFRSLTEGVVWVPDEAHVRAGVDGFVEWVVARPGTRVDRGDVLIVCRDPVLTERVAELAARVRELEARETALTPTDRVKAQIVREERRYAEQNLARAHQRAAELTIVSRTDGTFVVAAPEDLPQRYVHKGDHLGYVVDLSTITVRAVVRQFDIDLVRHRARRIDVRLAEPLSQPVPATITRIVPGATENLPSSALGSLGGGEVTIDPTDTHGVRALDKLFQVDLTLPSTVHVVDVGGRVHVRFDYGRAPLATQWSRQLRQLFLSRFNV